MGGMRLSAALLAALALPSLASAQSADLPRVFAGGGIVLASTDGASRMRLYDEDPLGIWLVEGGVRVARRLGVGAELVRPGVARASTRGISFQSFGEQREFAVLGMVRGRLAGAGRLGLDLTGGAGVLFQRHESSFLPCAVGCTMSRDEVMTNRASAFAFGADVPFRLARHFEIAAVGRYYFLNRGDHLPSDPRDLLPWQFEWRSSSRFGVGVTGRAAW